MKTGYLIGGIILATMSILAGSASMYLNVSHGAEVSALQGGLFFIGEFGRIAIPIAAFCVAAGKGMDKKWLLPLVTCGALSFYAGINNIADQAVKYLDKIEKANGRVERAKAEVSRIRTELLALGNTGSVTALETLAKTYADTADKENGRGGCGALCKKAEKNRDETLAKLADAQRKIELEGKLASANAVLDATDAGDKSGLATIMGWILGSGAEKNMMTLLIFGGGMILLMLEQLVYFIIPACGYIAYGLGREPVAPPAPVIVEKPVLQVVSSSERDIVLEKLLTMFMESETGAVETSGNALAERFGVSTSTFADWMKRWVAMGVITKIQVGPHKYRFSRAA